MDALLIFLVFPVATIIFAIALQRILNSPLLVAAVIFAIFLIITFTVFDVTFLIATFAYTILAFTVAILVEWHCRINNNCLCNRLRELLENCTNPSDNENNSVSETIEDILGNATENNNNSNNNNNGCSCVCRRYSYRRR